MRRSPLLPLIGFSLVVRLAAAQSTADSSVRPPAAGASVEDVAAGEQLFVSQCARCHGVGATGGIGPNLARPRLRHAPTDEALTQVILGGIPGTAMGGFWNLSADEAGQIAAYVRSLGRLPPEVLPGDPERGRSLYEGAGGCSSCHILAGQGAGWAPDLSEVGLRLSAGLLRQSLVDPGALQPVSPLPSAHGPYPAFLAVEVTTRGGRVIRGTRVSEDDFTLVLREEGGRLRSLDKAALRRVKKLPGRSPMPSYAAVFSPEELDDLVAFLAGLKGEP